jgi:hypothetical protein
MDSYKPSKKFFIFLAIVFGFTQCYQIIVRTQTEIVLARYHEKLDYLNGWSFFLYKKIFIYNKGDELDIQLLPKNVEVIRLNNVGCEAHTYLHHIITRREQLAPYTIFLPASYYTSSYNRIYAQSLFKSYPWHRAIFIHKEHPADTKIKELLKDFTIDAYSFSNSNNLINNPQARVEPSLDRPFGVWYEKNFPNNPVLKIETRNGIFSLRRSMILKNDPALYQKLMSYLDKSAQPEEVHYIERIWHTLFVG